MNPIMIDFPDHFVTERLLIRLPMPGDGKAVYEAVIASQDELKLWLPFAQHEQTEEDKEVNVREAHLNFLKREDLRFLIFLKDTHEFVGSSGLHNPNWSVPKFEIGYWLDSRYTGQGYMSEAVKGITDFAFRELKAHRLEIRCDLLNIKSRAIPERLGFELEGILKNEDRSVDGTQLRDTCIYAMIR
ncbi:GNAT family N-acetyltransferase [Paenibacillus sp. FJAT-26967]|uniref:GNAT family N-acetyltransferase n=1 Tax=Paenibacillus sp. FJAT-26967 TaxID=1729690 RepID=UPI000838A78D|nr:GNAT family N-acetyltransferase [Paenibacillus sp. FJAT-26967]